jgi:hypothetical protein
MRDFVWRKRLHQLFKPTAARRAKPHRPRFEEMEQRLTPAAPVVLSINRLMPPTPDTSAASVQYAVTFDQPVTGVDAADFKVAASGAAAVASVSAVGGGALYFVTLDGVHGNGSLRLDLIDNDTIVNGLSEPLGGAGAGNASFQGQSYSVLQAFPYLVSIGLAAPANTITNAASVSFTATFSTAVRGVDPSDFALAATGSVGATLTQVRPVSESVYTVTVSGLTGSGSLGLNLVDDGSIRDLAGNPLTTPNAPGAYQPHLIFGAGANPSAVAAGDVNGDGRADLAVANFDANSVSILLGNGNGSFQGQTSFATGTGPISVALADVNGDGKLDAIVANSNLGAAGSVGVLLGNGDGSFQAQKTYATGAYPAAVVAADVNGDGKADLATANRDGSASVLLGNGNGSFQGQATFAAAASPNGIAVADVNGDAKHDLVVVNRDSDSVSVLLGNGNGSFQQQTTYAVGVSPRSVAAADVNGDGNRDLVVANHGVNITASGIGVLLGNGNGTFQGQTAISGDRPDAAVVADINGDGKPDVITNDMLAASIYSFLGNGNGSFQAQTTLAAVGSNPSAVAVADFNGDGKVDLVTSNSAGSSASVLLNSLKGGFSSPSFSIDHAGPVVQSIDRGVPPDPSTNAATVSFTVTFSETVTGVDLADFALIAVNAAGTLAQVTPVSGRVYTVTVNGVVATDPANGTLGLNLVDNGSIRDTAGNLLTASSAPADFRGQQTFQTAANPRFGTLGDLNGDGKADLVVVNVNSNSVSVLVGNGDGSFKPQATFASGGTPLAVSIGDANDDGKPDLAFVSYTSNSVGILLGNGNGTFQGPQVLAAGPNPSSLAFADLNGDGRTDLAVSNNDSAVSVLLGNGNGAFQAPQSFAAGSVTRSLVIGDVNRDGRPDLVLANFGNNSIGVLLGNGNGTFQAQQTAATGAFPWSLALADVNGDGKPDLAIANRGQNNIGVLLGNGDGSFQTQATFATGARPYSVALGDINGDGKLDLAAANQNNNTASTLLGNGDGSFQGQQTFASGLLPSGAVLGDVNGDGKLDLAVSNGGAGSVSILLGNASAAFTGQTYTILAATTPTTTTLSAAPASPQIFGTPLTFTATISPAGAASGTVQFKAGGVNLGTPQNVTLVDGVPTATLTTSALGSGSHDITAVYSGIGDFKSSISNIVTQVVTPLATTTVLTANPNASTGGTLVTFTATVSPNPNSQGTVAFRDGGTTIANVPLVGDVATFQTSLLTVGTHPITAFYSGDSATGLAASTSNTLNFTVTGAVTTTTLSSGTPNPASTAQAITFTVTVAGGASTNGETVTLIDASNGNAPVTTTGGVLSAGAATIIVPAGALTTGTHNLVAVYAGNGFNAGSSSAPVAQTIGAVAAPSVTSVTLNGNIQGLAGPQRSRVASVVVTFNQSVQLDANAFTLALHTNSVTFNGAAQPAGFGTLPASLAPTSTDNITWVVTFTGNTDNGADGFNSLKDGVYDFNVAADKVHPVGLPGVNMASNSTTTIHRLFGDTNLPSTPNGGVPGVDFLAVINTGDNLAFRGAFNNAAAYKAFFDFNGDGAINSGDNLQFRNRFNKALTWKV